MRVALVIMPWVKPDLPPLGAAVLKSWLQSAGVTADCWHLNLRMAKRIGARPSMLIAAASSPAAEWLFAYHLFGPGGSGELDYTWEDARRQDWFQQLAAELAPDVSESRLQEIVLRDIPAFVQQSLDDIPWQRYDLIGFCSHMHSHSACLKMARAVKSRFPGKPIVLGGSNVEGEMGVETFRACPWIDYIVDGEGEEALLSLARGLEAGGVSGEDIPRLLYRRDGEPVASRLPRALFDLDRLPTPDHGDYFEELDSTGLNRQIRPVLSFESSRGCWWGQIQHCTFCGLNGESMPYRAKSTDLVLRDLEALHRKHRCTTMQACDTIIGQEHILRLAPALESFRSKHELDLTFVYEVKSNIGRPQMQALARAGLAVIQPGIESLSTPVLRLMRKGVRGIQNAQTLKLGRESGISLHWNFLYGFPGESSSDYDRMIDDLWSLTHLDPPLACGTFSVDRFSPYQAAPESFGLRRPRPLPVYEFLYPSSRLSLDKIAAYFELDVRDRPSMPYEAKLQRMVSVWKSAHQSFFVYVRGLDFIDLHDTRPFDGGRALQWRSYRLEGIAAFLFRLCATIKTIGEVTSVCRERFPSLSLARVQDALAEMVEKRWMFQEDNYFLSLAVPLSALTASQRILYERLRSAEWIYLSGNSRRLTSLSGDDSRAP